MKGAACGLDQGKNSFTQIKAQSLIVLEEIVRVIVHPKAPVEVKHAYFRLLNHVYAQSDVRVSVVARHGPRKRGPTLMVRQGPLPYPWGRLVRTVRRTRRSPPASCCGPSWKTSQPTCATCTASTTSRRSRASWPVRPAGVRAQARPPSVAADACDWAGSCHPSDPGCGGVGAEYLAMAVAPFMVVVLTSPGSPIRFTGGSSQHNLLVVVLQGFYHLTLCRWLPVVVKIEVETCIKVFFDMFRQRKLGVCPSMEPGFIGLSERPRDMVG